MVVPILVCLAAMLSACGPDDVVGESPSSSPSSPRSVLPATTVTIETTAVSAERPPAATPAELTHRTERMPWPTDHGLSPELAELLAAFERGDDWTGTLAGIAFLDVGADEWLMCWTIDESLPVGCGSGIALSSAPPVYLASPERFETQTFDSSDEPAVIISTSIVSVHGTFFADAAVFVPSHPEPTTGSDMNTPTVAPGTSDGAEDVPEDWIPTPALSQESLDDNPLVRDMLGVSEMLEYPEFAPYVAAIGVSRYVIADANGDPIKTDGDVYNERSIEITAYHGREQPIVYLLNASASYDDPDHGYQTDDRGALGLLVKEPGTNRYSFLAGADPKIFGDRTAYGDNDLARDEVTLIPFLTREFTIDIQADRSLIVTDELGEVTRLAWVEIEIQP